MAHSEFTIHFAAYLSQGVLTAQARALPESHAVDHEKEEMYAQFLFEESGEEKGELDEHGRVHERGPFPTSTVWVPSFQIGVARGSKVVDDGRRSWRPQGVAMPSGRESDGDGCGGDGCGGRRRCLVLCTRARAAARSGAIAHKDGHPNAARN